MKEFSTINGYGVKDPTAREGVATTTEAAIPSYEGGMPFVSMSGNSVQNSNNCVEMMQGTLSATTGEWVTSTTRICSTEYIPCASGNVVTIKTETTKGLLLASFYSDSAFISVSNFTNVSEASFTAPTNATKVRIVVGDNNGITPDTVGDISLTVGGKAYCVLVGSHNSFPNPDFPSVIENVGDCVEMKQGAYKYTDGTFGNSSTQICNVRPIPCKAGDKLVITAEEGNIPVIVYYKDGAYLSYGSGSTNVITKTVPSGATHFNFYVSNNNGVTPETVGKISVTVNGKYVVQIVENGKNLLKVTEILQGVRASANGNYSSNNSWVTVGNNDFAYVKQGKTYSVSANGVNWTRCDLLYYDENKKYISSSSQTIVTNIFIPNRTGYVKPQFYNANGIDVTKVVGFQIELGELTDYEEHTEKVATVLLDAQLRDTDVMSRTEVVRKRGTVVLNGSENWAYWGTEGDNYGVTLDNAFTYNNSLSNTTNALSNMFVPRSGGRLPEECLGLRQNGDTQYRVYLCLATSRLSEASVNGVKEWLAENPITLEYELATPIVETLDAESQIALNSLETFDSVTYINVDSRVKPKALEVEYGTTPVGARLLATEMKRGATEDALSSEINRVENKLDTDYSTTVEMNSAITKSASEIQSTVSATYETQDHASGVKENLQSQITQNAQSITSKVSKGSVSSEISQEAEQITITGNRLVINATNLKVDSSGNVTISGKLSAGKGSTIGGEDAFSVDNNSIFSGGEWSKSSDKTPTVFMCTGTDNSYTIAGTKLSNWALGVNQKFGVNTNGTMYCSSAKIGNIDFDGGNMQLGKATDGTQVQLAPIGLRVYYKDDDGHELFKEVTWKELLNL